MKTRILLIGAAVAALGVAGAALAADPPQAPRAPHARFEPSRIDANNDGFVSRAEAQSEAERMFAAMDDNNDGKLDAADREHRREVRVMRREVRHGDREEVSEDVIIERAPGIAPPAPGTTVERREVHKEIVKDGKEHRRGHRGGRHHGPHMMGGPMGLLIFAHSGEADRNNDGALSKEELVSQQLRFFDAADVNGDGKIKFEPPPEPPAPPEAPKAPDAPPAPPPPPRR